MKWTGKPAAETHNRRLCLAATLATLLAIWLSLGVPGGALEPENLLDARWLETPALSSDGDRVAFVVWEPVVGPEESVYRAEIHLAKTDGTSSFRLVSNVADARAPAFSPDGELLAFLSPRPSSGEDGERVEIWLIHPDGGEAWQLTLGEEGAGDVSRFAWAPDGASIAFLRRDPPSAERRAAVKALEDIHVEGQDLRYQHLHRIAVPADPATASPVAARLTSGELEVVDFDVSPDGSSFVLTHHPSPSSGQWRESDLSLLSAEGGEIRPLVRHPGMDTGGRFSPDGRSVAFASDRGERTWARDWRLCVVEIGAPGEVPGALRVLPRTENGMPQKGLLDGGVIAWAPDGSGLFYYELRHTDTQLYFTPSDGGAWSQVTRLPGEKFDFTMSRDGRRVAFVSSDFERPHEIWTQEIAKRPAQSRASASQASRMHRATAPLPPGRSEAIRWASFDGLEIEGILHLPEKQREGLRLPLLVELHGGPTWAFQRTYAFDARLMVAHGFAVLQVNPRGSDGYGREFRLANLGDWGGADVRDVLAGVDHVVGLGLVDAERLGVFGWSYGGFLTGQMISHSQRFGAAVIGAGFSNLVSMAGTTDLDGFVASFLESEFWEEPELWHDRSAVQHAAEITTPTLILHGDGDPRVPVTQGYELHRALRRAGVPVELVVYPRSGHSLSEPKLWVDELRRRIEWFQRWLRPSEAH